MRAVSANGYYGLAEPGGGTSNWIRTTTSGIIPYQSGGHGSLGTSSWPFSTVYANNFYGYLNGNISGSAASAGYTTRLYANSTTNLTTYPGDYSLAYSRFQAGASNIFPCGNNANGVITAHLHAGEYYAQIGLSSNGRMYYRTMLAQTLSSGVGWNQVAWSGESYTKSESDSRYVNITGDTMTGNLAIKSGNSLLTVYPTGTGNYCGIIGNMSTSSSGTTTHGLVFNASSCTSYGGKNSLTLFNTRGNIYFQSSLGVFESAIIQRQPNDWLTTAGIQIGRSNPTIYTDRAVIGVTNGNLHLDSYSGYSIYFNHYVGSTAGLSKGAMLDASGQFGIGGTPSAKLHSHGLVKITANSRTLTIGSQNADHCHYSTDSPCHWFNKEVKVAGNVYGGTNYNRRLAYADELLPLTTITKSIKVTTSWQNTGIYCSDIGTGAFVVMIESVSDYSNGGAHYSEHYVGLMASYAGGSNSGVTDEIPLHRCGHAPNSSILYLRTARVGSNASSPVLQIAGNYNMSAAQNITFKFRRII